MPTSLVIELAETADGRSSAAGVENLTSLSGNLVHGWFLTDLARRLVPGQVETMHDDRTADNPKPFTVSPAIRASANGAAEEAAIWHIRLTALSAQASDLFEAIRPQTVAALRLGPRRFFTRAVYRDRAEHQGAARCAYAELVALGRKAAVADERRVRLEFRSPTAFRRGDGGFSVFPDPERVFRSLLWRWHDVSGLPPLDAYDADQFVAALLVEEYQLASTFERHHDGKGRSRVEKGFTGWCEYSLGPRPRSEALEVLHTLAAFAAFSGVGQATARGWGQVWPSWRDRSLGGELPEALRSRPR